MLWGQATCRPAIKRCLSRQALSPSQSETAQIGRWGWMPGSGPRAARSTPTRAHPGLCFGGSPMLALHWALLIFGAPCWGSKSGSMHGSSAEDRKQFRRPCVYLCIHMYIYASVHVWDCWMRTHAHTDPSQLKLTGSGKNCSWPPRQTC